MHMVKHKALGILLGMALIAIPLRASAENIGVEPPEVLEFEGVDVGDSVTLPIVIMSLGPTPLQIYSIHINDDGGGVFEITSMPDLSTPFDEGESAVIEVTFTPSEVGAFGGELEIRSNDVDFDEQQWFVSLIGEGLEPGGEPTAGEQLDDLIAFFAESVEAGGLEGAGRVAPARRAHLRVFEHKLRLLEFFLCVGLERPACAVLGWLDARSDGDSRPRDMVEGPDRESLNQQILDLGATLGCH